MKWNYLPKKINTNTFLSVIWLQVTFPDFNVKIADKAHERLVCLPTMREDFYYERENTVLLPVFICLNLASSPTTQQDWLCPLFSSTASFQKKIYFISQKIMYFSGKSFSMKKGLGVQNGTYLSEMCKHVWASLTHFGKEDYRCVKDTWKKRANEHQKWGCIIQLHRTGLLSSEGQFQMDSCYFCFLIFPRI